MLMSSGHCTQNGELGLLNIETMDQCGNVADEYFTAVPYDKTYSRETV